MDEDRPITSGYGMIHMACCGAWYTGSVMLSCFFFVLKKIGRVREWVWSGKLGKSVCVPPPEAPWVS